MKVSSAPPNDTTVTGASLKPISFSQWAADSSRSARISVYEMPLSFRYRLTAVQRWQEGPVEYRVTTGGMLLLVELSEKFQSTAEESRGSLSQRARLAQGSQPLGEPSPAATVEALEALIDASLGRV